MINHLLSEMLPQKYTLLLTMSILFVQVKDRASLPLCSLLLFQTIVLQFFEQLLQRKLSRILTSSHGKKTPSNAIIVCISVFWR